MAMPMIRCVGHGMQRCAVAANNRDKKSHSFIAAPLVLSFTCLLLSTRYLIVELKRT